MEASERDIECVLITGAGASCEFGIGGHRFPLMTDWVKSLVRKLAGSATGYLPTTGLSENLSAQEFEETLGRFLREVLAFSQVENLVVMSKHFQHSHPGSSNLVTEGVLEGWYSSTKHHLGQIVELIHASLFEQFAEPPIDFARATEAFRRLFQALGIAPGTPWVYATTNYDRIADQVIAANGMRPDWGEPPQPAGVTERPVEVEGLIDGLGRYVPILHLHGRVGWYRQTEFGGDARAYSAAVTRHEAGFGVPIVMLPDPEKTYGDDPVIDSLWTQFNDALARAQRVFVLGHSLNDAGLIEALKDNVQPYQRIAITVLANEANPRQVDPSAEPLRERISAELAGAEVVPMRFGTEEANYQAVHDWLRTAPVD